MERRQRKQRGEMVCSGKLPIRGPVWSVKHDIALWSLVSKTGAETPLSKNQLKVKLAVWKVKWQMLDSLSDCNPQNLQYCLVRWKQLKRLDHVFLLIKFSKDSENMVMIIQNCWNRKCLNYCTWLNPAQTFNICNAFYQKLNNVSV